MYVNAVNKVQQSAIQFFREISLFTDLHFQIDSNWLFLGNEGNTCGFFRNLFYKIVSQQICVCEKVPN